MRLSRRFDLFDVANTLFFVAVSIAFLYPILRTVAVSFSDAAALRHQRIGLWPAGFSTDSYATLLSDGRIMRYYLNTVNYAVTGTILMLTCTSLLAYPLTFRDFRGRTLVTIILAVTMFFGGGLIPFYLVVLRLRLIDTMWALVIPPAVQAWNVFIFRTFFATIPDSLRESAHIDGAGHFTVLARIVLPLSKPLLATFTLFTVVAFWNDFFNPLIFLRSESKQPVQLFLRRILILVDLRDLDNMHIIEAMRNISSRTVQAAAVMITITPILCVYPFLQKYFTKGLLIGAIKA